MNTPPDSYGFAHLQECCVVNEDEVERVRPKPTMEEIVSIHSNTGHNFSGNYRLCWNYPPCEPSCTFAHGDLELQAWNGRSRYSLLSSHFRPNEMNGLWFSHLLTPDIFHIGNCIPTFLCIPYGP